MNTEYVWWAVILLLVGGGAVAFLALGRVPEIEDDLDDEPPPDSDPVATATAVDAGFVLRAPGAELDQGTPDSTTVPGSDEPTSASDTE